MCNQGRNNEFLPEVEEKKNDFHQSVKKWKYSRETGPVKWLNKMKMACELYAVAYRSLQEK